jgi:hypothetical protein
MAANKVTAARFSAGEAIDSPGLFKPPRQAGGFFFGSMSAQEELALARSRPSRRRSRLPRRRLARSRGCRSGGTCPGIDYRSRSLLDRGRLNGFGRSRAGFHELESRPSLGRDPPAAAGSFDQPLRKDVQIRHPGGEASCPVCPFAGTCRQDGHVAFEVLHDGKAIG